MKRGNLMCICSLILKTVPSNVPTVRRLSKVSVTRETTSKNTSRRCKYIIIYISFLGRINAISVRKDSTQDICLLLTCSLIKVTCATHKMVAVQPYYHFQVVHYKSLHQSQSNEIFAVISHNLVSLKKRKCR